MPGAVWAVPARPHGQLSWRRGERWHVWSRDGAAPSGPGTGGARHADADLEDAVVVAALSAASTAAAAASAAAAPGLGGAVGRRAPGRGTDAMTAGTQPGPGTAAPLPASARGVVRRFGTFTAVGGSTSRYAPAKSSACWGPTALGKPP